MAKKPKPDKHGKPTDRVRETIDWCLRQLSEFSPAVVILMERNSVELAENGPQPPRIEYMCGPGSAGGVLSLAYEQWSETGMPLPDSDDDDDSDSPGAG